MGYEAEWMERHRTKDSLMPRNRSLGGRSWGGEKDGCRPPSPIGVNRFGDKGQQMPLLLPTGCADRQDPFDKAVPVGTVRAKTALPPQHRPTQRLFGRIV